MIGSLISGMIGAGGANASGGAYGQAGQDSLNMAKQLAAENRQWSSPWYNTGRVAADKLGQLLGLGHAVQNPDSSWNTSEEDAQGYQQRALNNFVTTPNYQFRLNEGTKALDRSAAAKGGLFSGAQAKAVTDYGQNTASQEFNNYLSQLAGVSGSGLSANNATMGADTSLYKDGLNAFTQGNMGRASSYGNAANAMASGISSGVNNIFSAAPYVLSMF